MRSDRERRTWWSRICSSESRVYCFDGSPPIWTVGDGVTLEPMIARGLAPPPSIVLSSGARGTNYGKVEGGGDSCNRDKQQHNGRTCTTITTILAIWKGVSSFFGAPVSKLDCCYVSLRKEGRDKMYRAESASSQLETYTRCLQNEILKVFRQEVVRLGQRE